jgi:hypothetical protein
MWPNELLQDNPKKPFVLFVPPRVIMMGIDISREDLLDRHKRCVLMIDKAKQWLDWTILSDVPLNEKLTRASIAPEEENEAGLIGVFVVFLDNLRQSAPSVMRYQSLIRKIGDSIQTGEFMKMLVQITGKG